MRNFCENNKLTYDQTDGSCKTNREYCLSKALPFCNNDCYVTPQAWINEKIFGSTLGRSISAPSSYLTEGICELYKIVKNK